MPKSIDEQIADAKMEIAQYEHQMNRLIKKHKVAERKARTRRLIERGALLESFIEGAAAMSNEQIKALLQSVFASGVALSTGSNADRNLGTQ